MLKKIGKKEDGISAIEYVLIAILIAIAIIAGATYFGTTLNSKFSDAGTKLETANQ